MLTCIAVEDEPLALDLLEDNIKQIPFLHLVKRCKNAFEAAEVLQNENVDLIFFGYSNAGPYRFAVFKDIAFFANDNFYNSIQKLCFGRF